MSALVHCDGPGCDQTRDPHVFERAMFEGGWLRVDHGDGVRSLDFHSIACLQAWALEHPEDPRTTGTATTVVDGS